MKAISPHFKQRNRTGAVAVEFAVVLAVLMPFLLGVWEVGRYVNVKQQVINASREGARQASTGEMTKAEVKQFVLNYLKTAGLEQISTLAADETEVQDGGKVYIEVNVYDEEGTPLPTVDTSEAIQNYKIEVRVVFLYSDVEISPTNYFLAPDTTLSSSVYWTCMRDIELKVNDQIPLD